MGWLDWVFPERCLGCGVFGKLVCEKCEIGMGEADQICPGCGRNSLGGVTHSNCRKLTVMQGLVCLWEYEGVVRNLIGQSKYRYYFNYLQKLTSFSLHLFNRDEFKYFENFIFDRPVVVPIPLEIRRERNRGFNQAKVIGESVAVRYKLLLRDRWLVRTHDTGRQVGRSREERLVAMKGAFIISGKVGSQNSEKILLIDDVWTTGATMRECAVTLKKAGIKEVWGLVLAR